MVDAGVLKVTGDAAANSVLIEQTAASGSTASIKLTLDGGTSATYNDVKSVQIDAQGGDDVIQFATPTTIAATVDGGDGTDKIIGPNQDNTWTIDGNNSGTFAGIDSFSNVETLQGGSADDNFVFNDGGSLSGAPTAGVDGGGGNDAVLGPDTANAWTIDGADSGKLNGSAFSAIANLIGGKDADTFAFSPGGSISGLIDGGADDAALTVQATDTLDFHAVVAAVSVDLANSTATGVQSFQNIDAVIGGSGTSDTLKGYDASAVSWDITGADAGVVSIDGTGSLPGFAFSGMENLIGVSDTASDAFTFETGGSLTGTADGGTGRTDSLRVADSTGGYTVFNPTGGDDQAGTLSLDSKTISYAGIDHQDILGGDPANLDIYGTPFNDSIILQDDGTAGNGQMQVSFDGLNFYDGINFSRAFTFADPTGSLKVQGLSGADTIEVKSLDSLFSANLQLYGTALDSFGVPLDGLAADNIVFSGNIDTHGGFLDAWAPNIQVNDGVHIAVGNNDIVLRSRRIGIAELENLSPLLATNRSVSIDIGQNASLTADGGIYLVAQAEDRSFAEVIGANHEEDNFVIQPLLDRMGTNLLPTLPVKLQVKQSSATVTIGNGAVIHGGDTVGVSATAIADASGSASGALVTIGYGKATATATVDVQKNAQITSDDGAVVITADGEAKASISTKTETGGIKESSPKDTQRTEPRGNPAGVHASIAVSDANVTSHVTVAEGATIIAGKTANIGASGDVSSEAEADSSLYADGAATLAFGLQFSNADIHTTVDGNVTANMKPASVVKIEIDPTVTDPSAIGYVDYANNMIHVGPNALVTEDTVTYTNRYGTSIGGLVDGATYYVVQVPDMPGWIRLAPTETNAIRAGLGYLTGNVVDLAVSSDPALATADNVRSFDGADVNKIANNIQLRDDANSPSNVNKFATGQAVVYHDNGSPIAGLIDGRTYYIIVTGTTAKQLQSDARYPPGQVVQLAETENEALAGIAIDIGGASGSGYTLTADHVFDSGFTTGIGINAELGAEDNASAGGGLQSVKPDNKTTKWDSFKEKVDTNLPDKIFSSLSGEYDKNESKVNAGQQSSLTDNIHKKNNKLSFGAALAFTYATHTVKTEVGSTAVLKSNEDLEATATISDSFQIAAQSDAEPQQDQTTSAKTMISVAADVAIFNNTATAIVHGGAQLDALRATRVISSVKYPILSRPDTYVPTSAGEFVDSFRSDGTSALTKYLDTTLSTKGAFFNSWAASTAKAQNLGLAGSVNVLVFTNVSTATVESGALINQDTAWRDDTLNPHPNQGAEQSDGLGGEQVVTVAASNAMQTINMTGIFALPDLNIDLTDNVKFKDRLTLPSTGTGGSTGGFGGAFFISVQNNTAHAIVEDGAKIYSGADGGFNVSASENIFAVDLTQAGASGGKLAIAGSVAYVGVTNDTLAELGSRTVVTGRNAEVSAGDSEFQANWVGGIAAGQTTGVGIAVAINNLDRKTRAVIGDPDTLASTGEPIPATNSIDVTDDVTVKATVDGELWAFTIAGAASGVNPGGGSSGSVFKNDDALNGNSLPSQASGKINKPKSGIGFAAAVSVNLVTDHTQASIVDAGEVKAGGEVKISAESKMTQRAITGGAALAVGASEDKKALAGAISFNNLNIATRAFLLDTAVTAGALVVDAERRGDLITVSAGAGLSAGGNKGTTVAGSVSVNRVISSTRAYLQGTRINATGDGTVTAQDQSQITAVGGGIGISFTSGSSSKGLGFSIGFNEVNSDTLATIGASTLDFDGTLSVTARNDDSLHAVGISAGVAKGYGVAFTLGINLIENTDKAEILDSTQVSAASVEMLAEDSSLLNAFGGALGIGLQKFGAGAAVGWNSVNDTIQASIADQSVVSADTGNVNLMATDDATIVAYAVGIGISKAAVGAGVAINGITNTVKAFINASTVKAQGDVEVSATGPAVIRAVTIGIAGSASAGSGSNKGLAVGATVSVNSTSLTDEAFIDANSVVESSSRDIVLTSGDARRLFSYTNTDAVSVKDALDAGNVDDALRQSFADNNIKLSNDLTVSKDPDGHWRILDNTNSRLYDVTATPDSLAVTEVSGILATAGGGAVSLTAGSSSSGSLAIGAAVAIDQITGRIRSYVDSSSITAARDIDINADSAAVIDTTSVGVALSISASSSKSALSASISASVAHNIIDQTVEAYVSNSPNVRATAGSIDIEAASDNAVTATTVAASLAIAAGSSNGISLSGAGAGATNSIVGKSNAYLENSDVQSGGDVTLAASDASGITANVVAASGGGAAIGVSLAYNYIGYTADGSVSPVEVKAYSEGGSINAGGNLNQTAQSSAVITARVGAGAVAVAAGRGGNSISASGAGAQAENKIDMDVKSYIDNPGPAGVQAESVSLLAEDSSIIKSDVGAASLGISVAGENAVSLSIAVSLAQNEIGNDVAAYIQGAGQVKARNGDINVRAHVLDNPGGLQATYSSDNGAPVGLVVGDTARVTDGYTGGGDAGSVYKFIGNDYNYTTASGQVKLKTGDTVLENHGGLQVTYSSDEGAPVVLVVGDTVRVANGYTGGGDAGSIYKFVGKDSNYTTASGQVTLKTGDTVLVADGFTGKGVVGTTYKYVGTDGTVDLGKEDYANNPDWQPVTTDLNAEDYSDSNRWQKMNVLSCTGVVGATYRYVGTNTTGKVDLGKEDYANSQDWQRVTTDLNTEDYGDSSRWLKETTISAVSVAASLAAGIGGDAGIAISGAGAEATNVIRTKANAYVADSSLVARGSGAGDVVVEAQSDSSIKAVIIGASVI